jgi:hypothetical protein
MCTIVHCGPDKHVKQAPLNAAGAEGPACLSEIVNHVIYHFSVLAVSQAKVQSRAPGKHCIVRASLSTRVCLCFGFSFAAHVQRCGKTENYYTCCCIAQPQHYDNLFTFSAMNIGYNAFLEMPLSIATGIMLAFNIPVALVIEYWRMEALQASVVVGTPPIQPLHCYAPIVWSESLKRVQVAASWLASMEKQAGLPLGFLSSAAAKIAISMSFHIGTHLLLNGPRMLARRSDSSGSLYMSVPAKAGVGQLGRRGQRGSRVPVPGPAPGRSPLGRMRRVAARLETWTAASPVMRVLLSPVHLPAAWEAAEARLFSAALALVAPRALVPLLSLPVVLYTLVT